MTASRSEPPLPADAVFVDTTGLVAPTMSTLRWRRTRVQGRTAVYPGDGQVA